MLDLTIIGAGPAGFSAAIHAKRFNIKFKIVDKGAPGGQIRSAYRIDNYPGMKSISGKELSQSFISQAASLGIQVEKYLVKKISNQEDHVKVETDKEPLISKAVIFAIGLEPIRVSTEISEKFGQIYYYPVADEIDHSNKSVLIIGGGDAAFDEALSFSHKARNVTIAMRSDKPRAHAGLIKEAGGRKNISILNNMSDEKTTDVTADVVVACIGKTQNLNLLDSTLRDTRYEIRNTVLMAGDIKHPNIRHVAAAVGDGVTAVEEYENNLKDR